MNEGSDNNIVNRNIIRNWVAYFVGPGNLELYFGNAIGKVKMLRNTATI